MHSRQGDKGCDYGCEPCQQAIRTNRLVERAIRTNHSGRLELIARSSGRLVSNRPC